MSANVRPAMRPSRLAVSWGLLFLLTRPASNSANRARNLANSAGDRGWQARGVLGLSRAMSLCLARPDLSSKASSGGNLTEVARKTIGISRVALLHRV